MSTQKFASASPWLNSGIMHRSFRAVSLTTELRSKSSTPCMKGSSALQMFIRRHSSSSLRWLAGSLFQSFRSSSSSAEVTLPESGKHLLTLAVGGRIPGIDFSHSSPARPICLVSHKPLFPTRFFSSLRLQTATGCCGHRHAG